MTSVLKMPFTLENGKTVTFSLNDPKSGLTLSEVETAMGYVITENAILYGGAISASSAGEPYIYNTEKVLLTDD